MQLVGIDDAHLAAGSLLERQARLAFTQYIE